MLGVGVAGYVAWRYWPREGMWNLCPTDPLPEELVDHELVRTAWQGIEPREVWDCHAHLGGVGDGDSGVWLSPQTRSLAHPLLYAQHVFYRNAACVETDGRVDRDYVERLRGLLDAFPAGARAMLLAFDWHHDENGARREDLSALHVPNDYARDLARRHPERFEWIASIHPYRADAVEALAAAVRDGARAVKWLPPAMGMDPGSPRCDRFYEALVRHGLPLLTHAGDEMAVHAGRAQALGNPLRLRRALDHGVRVIVAHCASLGTGADLDRGPDGPRARNFDLFARLMDEPRYERLLFGDLSAITQVNRAGRALETILERTDWHPRLLNGSDYPLVGVMPLISHRRLAERGLLDWAEADALSRLRRHNPLLADFVLKRRLRRNGHSLPAQVFQTRRVFSK
jgi:mannonate dehydratase